MPRRTIEPRAYQLRIRYLIFYFRRRSEEGQPSVWRQYLKGRESSGGYTRYCCTFLSFCNGIKRRIDAQGTDKPDFRPMPSCRIKQGQAADKWSGAGSSIDLPAPGSRCTFRILNRFLIFSSILPIIISRPLNPALNKKF